jgi:hypothetical protein
MLKPKIVDISYARISTSHTAQLSSLGNQVKKLSDLTNGNVIKYIGSGGEEFPDELKNQILEERKKNNDVRINIMAFDRLTRNFKDMDFLVKNVRYINVLDENKTYDVKNEMEQIVLKITKCVQELELIKIRCSRYNINRKREREEDSTTENTDSQIFALRKRCLAVFNNLSTNGVTDNILLNLEKLVRISQNLDSLKKWDEMFSLIKSLGINTNNIKKQYENCLNEYKNKKENPIYKIDKKDITELVFNILEKQNCKDNDIFVNQFINSNIRYANL